MSSIGKIYVKKIKMSPISVIDSHNGRQKKKIVVHRRKYLYLANNVTRMEQLEQKVQALKPRSDME